MSVSYVVEIRSAILKIGGIHIGKLLTAAPLFAAACGSPAAMPDTDGGSSASSSSGGCFVLADCADSGLIAAPCEQVDCDPTLRITDPASKTRGCHMIGMPAGTSCGDGGVCETADGGQTSYCQSSN